MKLSIFLKADINVSFLIFQYYIFHPETNSLTRRMKRVVGSSFFKKIKDLFIFGCAGSSLLCGLSLFVVCGLLMVVASLIVEHMLYSVDFSRCGLWALWCWLSSCGAWVQNLH